MAGAEVRTSRRLGARTVEALLAASGLPRSEASLLLAHASGWSRTRLVAGSRDPVPDAIAATFLALAARRGAGEPIAYCVGTREFYGRLFAVDRRVLIPRPETELLVELALGFVDATGARRVVDLGTGSGAIAITLALERPALDVTAVDRSADALAVAAANALALGATVRFVAADWYDGLAADAAFDVVVANPPYVAAGDAHLDQGDLRFEPSGALTDGGDGLDALRRVIGGAPARLAPGGLLVVEHGYDQAWQVRALMVDAGLDAVASARDLGGIERTTQGRRAARAPGTPDAAGLTSRVADL